MEPGLRKIWILRKDKEIGFILDFRIQLENKDTEIGFSEIERRAK
jgi:hypothetical protein